MNTADQAGDERMTRKHTEYDEITVPVSLRLPANLAVTLFQYAAKMDMSAAKIVANILEDALPTFEEGNSFDVRIRVSQIYRAMANAGMLKSVKERAIRDRVLKRTEPGGPMGRPSKKRQIESAV